MSTARSASPPVVSPLVRDVLTARVYEVAVQSPLTPAPKLSAERGCQVYLKREDMQAVHSFKVRGAYNKICRLTSAQRRRGVIAASAGNHAQGVALAAHTLGLSALIVMPRTTPAIKIDAVRRYGAAVELHGDNYSEAADYCQVRTRQTGRVFIHPFDDPLVIAGQGTIGREILEQLPAVSHLFVPVGGGGMLAGIAGYVKAVRPDVRIISVEPADSNAMAASIQAGRRVQLAHIGIFADGVAVRQVGRRTFAAARTYVDDFITVSTDQICAATKAVFETTRSIVEPAGALSLAGLQQYPLPGTSHAVAICSGANVTFERLQQIAERTLIGSGREALVAVTMPEQPGALSRFCRDVLHGRSITEFSYRLRSRLEAHVLVGIGVADAADRVALLAQIARCGYVPTDLSDNDTAKEHVRYMVGGAAGAAHHEQLYNIDFPERPGALADFLTRLGGQWNISLFHYRSAASDTGRVLIGFEVPDPAALATRLAATGLTHTRVTEDTALQIFC